jgi:hypothetical protein
MKIKASMLLLMLLISIIPAFVLAGSAAPSNAPSTVDSIAGIDWPAFWGLFHKNTKWEMFVDGERMGGLNIKKSYQNDNTCKITISFVAPQAGDYLIAFNISNVVSYIASPTQFSYNLSFAGYEMLYNWSDIALTPGLTFSHGVENAEFYFCIEMKGLAQHQKIDLDPSIVATSINNAATAFSHQTKAGYQSGLHWMFYTDGSETDNLLFKTSADGVAWSAATMILRRVGGAEDSLMQNDGRSFGVFFDGTYVHIAAGIECKEPENNQIKYRRGQTNSSGGITWSADWQGVWTCFLAPITYSTVAVDSNGYPWVALNDHTTSTPNTYVFRISKSGANDGTWTSPTDWLMDSNIAGNPYVPLILPLLAGKMYSIHIGCVSLDARMWGRLYDVGWGSWESISTDYKGGISHDAIAIGNNVHVVWLLGSANKVTYRLRTFGVGWASPYTLATSTDATMPSITKIGSSSMVFWMKSYANDDIYYRNGTGTSWSAETYWFSDSTNSGIWYGTTGSFYEAIGYSVGFYYTRNSASPYNVMYNVFELPAPPEVTVTIVKPQNTTYTTSTIPVEITASDGIIDEIWYNCKNGTSWIYVSNITYTVPTSMTGFVNGTSYKFYAWANNTEGSSDEATVMFSVSIPPTPPPGPPPHPTQISPVFAYEMQGYCVDDDEIVLLDSSEFKSYGTAVPASAPQMKMGALGYGLYFNGSSIITVSDADNLRLYYYKTITAWIKTDVENEEQGIVSKAFEFDFYISSGNKVIFKIYDGSSWYFASSNTSIAKDTWYFVSGVYCSISATTASLSVSINTVEEDRNLLPSGFNTTTNNMIIGQSVGGGKFEGIIDELQGYNRVLDRSELTLLRATQIEPPPILEMIEGSGYYGFYHNYFETPWCGDTAYANASEVKVTNYMFGFAKYHSIVEISQSLGEDDINDYFEWSFNFYKLGELQVTYKIKLRVDNFTTRVWHLWFWQIRADGEYIWVYNTFDFNGTISPSYDKIKLTIDAWNDQSEKRFGMRVTADPETLKVDSGFSSYEYFFNTLDSTGNIRNLQWFDPAIKTVMKLKTGGYCKLSILTHQSFPWLIIIGILVFATIVGGLIWYLASIGNPVAQAIVGVFQPIFQPVLDFLSNLAAQIAAALRPIGDWIVKAMASSWSLFCNALDAALAGLGLGPNAFTNFCAAVVSVFSYVANILAQIPLWFSYAFSTVGWVVNQIVMWGSYIVNSLVWIFTVVATPFAYIISSFGIAIAWLSGGSYTAAWGPTYDFTSLSTMSFFGVTGGAAIFAVLVFLYILILPCACVSSMSLEPIMYPIRLFLGIANFFRDLVKTILEVIARLRTILPRPFGI